MARARSPNRYKAFEIYKEHDGNIANREIAKLLDISEKTISGWKVKDKWNESLNRVLQKEIRSTSKEKRNKGGQPKNKNALGNNGGAPPGNKNAEKFGFFSKYLPEETLDLMKEISEKNQLDILWEQITIQYAAIIRAQRIMYVDKKDEMIKELKKEETSEYGQKIEYEFQFAWDRQATFLNAQSRAMGELRSLIKQYESMVNANWNLITEEQKARLDLIKAQTNKLTGDNQEIEDTSDIESEIYGN
ncbi:MAG: phage terminase small subunit [Paeniclostridium sordellii]|nr:phage terminase small subunit [Paeniclostridium sordellii]